MDYITEVALMLGGIGAAATFAVAILYKLRHRRAAVEQPELPFYKPVKAA